MNLGFATIGSVINPRKHLDSGVAQAKTHASRSTEKIYGFQISYAFLRHPMFFTYKSTKLPVR